LKRLDADELATLLYAIDVKADGEYSRTFFPGGESACEAQDPSKIKPAKQMPGQKDLISRARN